MRFSGFQKKSQLLALLLLPLNVVNAFDVIPHRQRTRTNPCLPRHNYDHGVWPYTTPGTFKTTAIAVAATDPTTFGQQIKPFHFRATALTLDQLKLDRVGIALHESSGKLFATGQITHNGGDGGLIGNNVTIRIRAYISPATATAGGVSLPIDSTNALPIASPNDVTRIPPDAYAVWASETNLWVSRGGPHSISLLPPGQNFTYDRNLHRHFNEITHLEVELEYKRDR